MGFERPVGYSTPLPPPPPPRAPDQEVLRAGTWVRVGVGVGVGVGVEVRVRVRVGSRVEANDS